MYTAIDKKLRRAAKLEWLATHKSVSSVEWRRLSPNNKNTWLVPASETEFQRLPRILAGENGEGIFQMNSLGVTTARDSVVYSFSHDRLASEIPHFVEAYNSEVDRFRRAQMPEQIDDFVRTDQVKWSEGLKLNLRRLRHGSFSPDNIKLALWRPFCMQYLYYDGILNERIRAFGTIFPSEQANDENVTLALTNLGSEKPFMALVSEYIVDYHLVGGGAGAVSFPFFVYDEDGTNRRENITDWAMKQFREQYKDKNIGKWDIFHYVYGLLHHPGYREKFADNLKRELPRIPFAPDFRAFAKAGEKLAKLHLDYEKFKPWELEFIETPGVPLSYRVEDKMRLSKDKLRLTVNSSLTLSGIPPEAFNYRLGNRSALEWVIDQYQVSTDKRSGITSDPNRDADPEYIVRLIGQVIRVSMATEEIVDALPAYSSEKT